MVVLILFNLLKMAYFGPYFEYGFFPGIIAGQNIAFMEDMEKSNGIAWIKPDRTKTSGIRPGKIVISNQGNGETGLEKRCIFGINRDFSEIWIFFKNAMGNKMFQKAEGKLKLTTNEKKT